MMKSQRSLSALRTALVPWALLALALGVVMMLFAGAIDSERWEATISALASALLSIAGALFITELVLKPLYVRDILQVARLSADVHETGLKAVARASRLQWAEHLAGSDDLKIVAGNLNAFRIALWGHVMTASRAKKRVVTIFVADDQSPSVAAQELVEQWRKNGCGDRGSTIRIVPERHIPQSLLLANDRSFIVALAEDPLNDDPVMLVFSASTGEAIDDSLRRGIERLASSPVTPLYEG